MKFALTISDLSAAELFGIQKACDGLTQDEPIATPAPVVNIPAPIADPGATPTMQAIESVTTPLPPVVSPPAPVTPIAAPIGDNAPAPVAQTTVERDSEGAAYDPTLHATPATKTVKGIWRKKRKPKAVVAPAVAPVQAAPAPQPSPNPPVVPEPPAPAPTTAPEPPAEGDFVAFMAHVSGQMGVQGADGLPMVSVEVLASVTAEISQAFQTPLSTITDIQKDPRVAQMVVYATQVLQRDNRW